MNNQNQKHSTPAATTNAVKDSAPLMKEAGKVTDVSAEQDIKEISVRIKETEKEDELPDIKGRRQARNAGKRNIETIT